MEQKLSISHPPKINDYLEFEAGVDGLSQLIMLQALKLASKSAASHFLGAEDLSMYSMTLLS